MLIPTWNPDKVHFTISKIRYGNSMAACIIGIVLPFLAGVTIQHRDIMVHTGLVPNSRLVNQPDTESMYHCSKS